MKITLERFVLIDSQNQINSLSNSSVYTSFNNPETPYYDQSGQYPKLYKTAESALQAAKQMRSGLVKKVKVSYEIDDDYELPIDLVIKYTKSRT